MGIYARDQIQYANMLQNALQNRARAIEREGDNIRGRGQMWGSAINTAGNTLKDAAYTIASYKHGDEQAQKQRDFTAEQAALRAKEAMERQAAQMDFQSAENALNRQNTMAIAQLNRQNTIDAQKADKAAIARRDIQIQNALIGEYEARMNATENQVEKAQLQANIDKARANIEYNAQLLTPEEQLSMFEQQKVEQKVENPQVVVDEDKNLEKLAAAVSAGHEAKTSKDVAKQITVLEGLDKSKLDDNQLKQRSDEIEKLRAREKELKNQEDRRAKRKAEHDRKKKEAGTNTSKLADLQADYPEFYK